MMETLLRGLQQGRRTADAFLRARPEVIGHGDRNLAVIEHSLIGSTPHLSGKPLHPQERDILREQARDGNQETRRKLLMPIRIQEEGLGSLRRVVRMREAAWENKEYTGLPILDYQGIQDDDVGIYLELAFVDRPTGLIVPQWKLHLLQHAADEISDPDYWKNVQVIDSEKEWYTIEEVPNKNYRLLVAHLEPEKELSILPKAA